MCWYLCIENVLIDIYGLFLFGLVKLISGYQNLKSTCPKGYQGFWNFASPDIYTVGTESIQTPLNFSLFVILQPFAKII